MSEKAMNGVGAPIALMPFVAKQCFPVASSQDERGAQSSRPAADDENIDFHERVLSPDDHIGLRAWFEPFAAIQASRALHWLAVQEPEKCP
jgi:hypothetical protein